MGLARRNGGDVLNDPAWNTTTSINSGNNASGDHLQAKTEVFIGYTDRALYIGVVCYDLTRGIIVSDSHRMPPRTLTALRS